MEPAPIADLTVDPAAVPSAPAPVPADPPRWTWPRVRRGLAVGLAILFVIVHASAAVHKMMPSKVTRKLPGPVATVLRLYGRNLRLAGRWNMFGSPPDNDLIWVEGASRSSGPWYDLANPFVRGFDLFARIRDARLRKFHQKFSSRSQRDRWGRPYLAYLCRAGKQAHPELHHTRIVKLAARVENDRGVLEKKPRTSTLMRYRCGDPVKLRHHGRRRPPPVPRAGDGEDL